MVRSVYDSCAETGFLRLPEPLNSKFWAKVDRTEGCWLWTANKDGDGYGMFESFGKRKPHRLTYEMFKGIIYNSMHVYYYSTVEKLIERTKKFLEL